jgi:predicted RNA-binding Zn-ribbon protein involved in translation (DUF1610 family)
MNEYRCNNCDFTLPSGSGGYSYIEDESGMRINYEEKSEKSLRTIISEIWGFSDYRNWKELVRIHTGFNSYCICLDCLNIFEADISPNRNGFSKDDKVCPKCSSNQVHTELELVGKECPSCNEGKIGKIIVPLI